MTRREVKLKMGEETVAEKPRLTGKSNRQDGEKRNQTENAITVESSERSPSTRLSSSSSSSWRSKLDGLYLAFFVTHIPIILRTSSISFYFFFFSKIHLPRCSQTCRVYHPDSTDIFRVKLIPSSPPAFHSWDLGNENSAMAELPNLLAPPSPSFRP